MLYRLVVGLIIMSLQYGKDGHPHLHIWSARPIPADLLAQVFTEATDWRADVQAQPLPFTWQEAALSPEAAIRYALRSDSADYQPSRWRHLQAIEEEIPAAPTPAWFAVQGDPLDFGTGGLDVKPCPCRVKTLSPVIRPFAASIMRNIDKPVSDINDAEINPVSCLNLDIHAMNGRRRSNGIDGSGFT